jgi:hypothetical protein
LNIRRKPPLRSNTFRGEPHINSTVNQFTQVGPVSSVSSIEKLGCTDGLSIKTELDLRTSPRLAGQLTIVSDSP